MEFDTKCNNCGSTFDLREAKIGVMRRRHCPTCGTLIRWGLNRTKLATGAGLLLLVTAATRPSLVAVVVGLLIVMAFSAEVKKT